MSADFANNIIILMTVFELSNQLQEKNYKKDYENLSKIDKSIGTFEELGVDELIVDEAHMFKNLPMYSKIRNVAGINNSESKKATDSFMKIRVIYLKTTEVKEQYLQQVLQYLICHTNI